MLPKRELSKIKVGTKIVVEIIDELPDGDGLPFFTGEDEVLGITKKGHFMLLNSALIAKPSEVLEIKK